ncbi:MAG: dioxygenase [Melioribacteraceae bacterium]|nr:MAG: dioxygenase [Melioribacteraceae bacterium]
MKGSIVYFSHGGGPLPVLGDPGHSKMNEFMERLPKLIDRPEAIIVFSAHWEEERISIINSERPALYLDYYGFPDEAYKIKYEVHGNPKLAEKVFGVLQNEGIDARFESERGIDHGVFIPLKMMYPEADIPVVQISLLSGLDPLQHIKLGELLRGLLAEQNILIIGSGFSFHNMREFFNDSDDFDERNQSFQNWLGELVTGDSEYKEMREKLINWKDAPSAKYCHPREEHLIPLHVCVGAAGRAGEIIFDDLILGKRALAFKW